MPFGAISAERLLSLEKHPNFLYLSQGLPSIEGISGNGYACCVFLGIIWLLDF